MHVVRRDVCTNVGLLKQMHLKIIFQVAPCLQYINMKVNELRKIVNL
jgi:hypothetical protein